MAKRGLLERKVAGAVDADVPFSFEKLAEKANTQNKPKEKKNFENQKVSIKIPADLKIQIDAIKKMQAFKFDYEAIQFLADNYVKTLSEQDMKRFNLIEQVLK